MNRDTYDKAQSLLDQDPHKAARFAMWYWAETYAPSGLGSMGFWDSLTAAEKDIARRAVAEILSARDE